MRQRSPGLDALRAAATLLVLFAHGGYFLYSVLPHYDSFALSGWLGTELFFALSGFLVAVQLLAEPPQVASHALRYVAWRAWRILPLFWLALIAHVVLAEAGGREVPEALTRYALLTQNLAQPQPAFFGEAWNLPLLMLFSLAAPGMVLGLRQLGAGTRGIAFGFASLLLVGMALRMTWVSEFDPSWDEGVRKLVATRLDACAYGALAACLMFARHPLLSSRKRALGLAVIASILACAGFLWLPRDISDLARVGLFSLSGVAAALACAGLFEPGSASRPQETLLHQTVRALARISYPLYLINMPMLFALELAGWGQSSDATQAVLRFMLWLALSLLVAIVLHRSLERPLLAWRQRTLSADAASATNR